jgi:hypothetical protein
MPSYTPGASKGYYVWDDGQGNWFVRMNSNGERINFTGSVRSTIALSGVKPFSLESVDSLDAAETEILFDCWSSSSHDGFDFTVSKDAVLTFDFRMNGERLANSVYLGSAQHSPDVVPFSIGQKKAQSDPGVQIPSTDPVTGGGGTTPDGQSGGGGGGGGCTLHAGSGFGIEWLLLLGLVLLGTLPKSMKMKR